VDAHKRILVVDKDLSLLPNLFADDKLWGVASDDVFIFGPDPVICEIGEILSSGQALV